MVEAVGADVDAREAGDRVAYAGPIGGYAEERLIDADRLVKLPDGHLDRAGRGDDAAGHDRRRCCCDRCSRCKAGDTILVHAAAGGVGLIMCQWAAALGATVIGTVGDRRESRARASPRLRPPDRLFAAGFRRRGRAASPTATSCRWSMIRSARDTFLRSLDCLQDARADGQLRQCLGPGRAVRALACWRRRARSTSPGRPCSITSRRASSSSIAPASCSRWSPSGKVKIEVQQRFALEGRRRSPPRARGAQDHRLDHPHGLTAPAFHFRAARR